MRLILIISSLMCLISGIKELPVYKRTPPNKIKIKKNGGKVFVGSDPIRPAFKGGFVTYRWQINRNGKRQPIRAIDPGKPSIEIETTYPSNYKIFRFAVHHTNTGKILATSASNGVNFSILTTVCSKKEVFSC